MESKHRHKPQLESVANGIKHRTPMATDCLFDIVSNATGPDEVMAKVVNGISSKVGEQTKVMELIHIIEN